MPGSLKIWIDSVRFAYEVRTVIAMRRGLLTRADARSGRPARVLPAQERAALADAEAAIVAALAHGEGLMRAAERAYAPVRRWVGANHRRLLGALGSDITAVAAAGSVAPR